ncbi:MAG: BtrH N-terminal domain-containing protein [Comamonadaceae bacterium]|nr:BtrH N-terminal domain-containing protein [Comamonadaceae bacterium]
MTAFEHRHAGHCESGTVSALLRHQGLSLSEPMVFGIGGGLFFLHMPLVKMAGIPLTSYRDAPRAIIKNLARRLGIRWRQHRYRTPEAGMRALDEFLAAGRPVGLQTSVYWLPYFPTDHALPFQRPQPGRLRQARRGVPDQRSGGRDRRHLPRRGPQARPLRHVERSRRAASPIIPIRCRSTRT